MEPLTAVFHRGEAACRIFREPRGDGGVGTVPEQPQGDVHADFGASSREEGTAAGEVRAGVALAVAERSTLRAQLVIESIHLGVVILADVARAGSDEVSGHLAGRRRFQLVPAGFIIDPVGSCRGRLRDYCAIGLGDQVALGDPAVAFDSLEHLAGGAPNRDIVRVLLVIGVDGVKNLEAGLDVLRRQIGGVHWSNFTAWESLGLPSRFSGSGVGA
ncbi:hypothetical protein D9M72_292410 [compost metagenome]